MSRTIEEFLQGRIKHARIKVNSIREYQGDEPNERYNYFGGWDLGYWEGKLFVYEDILDEIESRVAGI